MEILLGDSEDIKRGGKFLELASPKIFK